MKKLLTVILTIILAISAPLCVFAQGDVVVSADAPSLTSISFKNAKITEQFSPYKYEYTLQLENTAQTPTLNDYQLQGDANIYISYNTDLAGRQTAVVATLKFANGSVIYTFNYANANTSTVNSNNNLAVVECALCQVYPELNDKNTKYTLYIPSDLTQIDLSVATQDIGAHCTVPGTITLTDDQEIEIPITVIASDSTAKTYTFDVKRLDKTCEQVKIEMAQSDFTSLVDEHITIQRTETAIVIGSIVGGLILLAIFVKIAKRVTVKVSDNDEMDFFDVKIEDNSNQQ